MFMTNMELRTTVPSACPFSALPFSSTSPDLLISSQHSLHYSLPARHCHSHKATLPATAAFLQTIDKPHGLSLNPLLLSPAAPFNPPPLPSPTTPTLFFITPINPTSWSSLQPPPIFPSLFLQPALPPCSSTPLAPTPPHTPAIPFPSRPTTHVKEGLFCHR